MDQSQSHRQHGTQPASKRETAKSFTVPCRDRRSIFCNALVIWALQQLPLRFNSFALLGTLCFVDTTALFSSDLRDYITYLVGREKKRAMTGIKDEGPAEPVASGGVKFVLEPKEVVSTVK
jgi:hypothetical protein